jgi:hypothetical protein
MFTKSTITFLALGLAVSPAFAQSPGDYRSISSGDWNNAAIWETFDGQDWNTPEMYPVSTDGMIYINSGHDVVLTSDEIVDELIVAGTLTLSSNRILLLDGNISVSGSMNIQGRMMCSDHTVTGIGSFTLSPGATLLIGSEDGIASTDFTGNIQTNQRTYSNFANYVYCGAKTQLTGNGLPAFELHGTLTVDNESGCLLSNNITLSSKLMLQQGALCLNGKTLTVNSKKVIAKEGATLNLCGGNIADYIPAQDGISNSVNSLTAGY